MSDVSASTPMVVDFHFDPVCPFAWMTSRWMMQVAPLRNLDVQWRFISLRMVNGDNPNPYRRLHDTGLRLLRIAAAARTTAGNDAVGAWYTAVGSTLWNTEPTPGAPLLAGRDDPAVVTDALRVAGLPDHLADAADDLSHDDVIASETAAGLERVGGDAGTPIITFGAPDGPAFFGPVISRLSDDQQAVALWDAVVVLAGHDSFSELKRSARSMPDLAALRGFGA